MKVLAIRQPWAEEIISGRKTIEVRSRSTNIRERVAIYATRTKPTRQDFKWLNHLGILINHHHIRGYIIGTVEIYGTRHARNADHFHKNLDNHLCYQAMYKEGQHFWYLRNACRVSPVPFKMPRGTVVWSSVDDDLIEGARLI